LKGRGKRRLRPPEKLRERLTDGVRISVDRLLAHEDEVGLLFLDERLERTCDDE
jgi:hypothetical protein